MWIPQNVEAVLQAASLLRLGVALLGPALQGQRGTGAGLHMFGMALLAVLSSVLDRRGPSWFHDHPLYVFRACGQAGLAQGLLALPSLATAISVATRSWWWQQAARLFLASSFQILLWYCWTAATPAIAGTDSQPTHPNPNPTKLQVIAAPTIKSRRADSVVVHSSTNPLTHGHAQDTSPSPPQHRRPFLPLLAAATAACCLLSAAAALLHAAAPPPPSSPQLLLPGSVFELPRDITASAWALQAALLAATAPALDHLATALPRSFTPGEAGILVQALLALGAGSAAYLAGASRQGLAHLLWCRHVAQPDPGMHVPAFCMLVLFWTLLLAACSALALLGRGRQDGDRRGDAAAAAAQLPAASTAAVLRRRRTVTSSEPRSGVASEARLRQVVAASNPAPPGRSRGPDGRSGRDGDLDRIIAVAVRVGGAAGAALSFAMLVDLALWVLGRFVAASSQPRLATLAYWFGCLAVAVPFMYVVSRASAARSQEQQQHKARLEQEEEEEEALQQEDQVRGQEGKQELAAARDGQQSRLDVARAGAGGARVAAANGSGGAGEADSGGGGPTGRSWPAIVQRQQQQQQRQQQTQSRQSRSQEQQQGRRRRGRSAALAASLFRLLGVPHIVMRKGYHLLAIVLFLPAFGWDVRMLQASLAVAGAVLVLLEVMRCLGPARMRAAIGGFMADFADARDSGPVYVTHFTLLLGIAVPVWLGDSVCGAAAGAMMAGLYGREAAEPMLPAEVAEPPLSAAAAALLPSCRTVLGLSGLVSLGSGDTAAACVGFLVGRRRLFLKGKKTWEGTLSGAAAMLGSWAVVVWWMDVRWALTGGVWESLAAATAGVAMLEAVTQQLDNVVVPLYYMTHLVLTMTGN